MGSTIRRSPPLGDLAALDTAHSGAKATGEPLLFKGDDFARTDIQAAA